jgi:hypothetical protein
LRLLAILAVCIAVCGPGEKLLAKPSLETAAILAQNPVLARVAQLDPNILKSLLSRLGTIPPSDASRKETARGGAPTQAERAQLVANPAFAQKFRQNPAETLDLLRQINEFLRSNSSQGH